MPSISVYHGSAYIDLLLVLLYFGGILDALRLKRDGNNRKYILRLPFREQGSWVALNNERRTPPETSVDDGAVVDLTLILSINDGQRWLSDHSTYTSFGH